MNDPLRVKSGFSQAPDEYQAAAEIETTIRQPDAKLVLFFASSYYDPEKINGAMGTRFGDLLLVGCTTAGEITPGGFKQRSITALSLASDKIDVAPALIREITEFSHPAGQKAVGDACRQLGVRADDLTGEDYFGLTLIDGLRAKEEVIMPSLSFSAPQIKIVGGSAADDNRLNETHIFAQGETLTNAALFLLFKSQMPFEIIKTEHLLPTEKKVVITKAYPESRRVIEINGKPAKAEYAHLLGVGEADLNMRLVAQHPFAYYVGDEPFIRSVSGLADDGLRFACAIEEGVVLTLMEPGDMIEDTGRAIRDTEERLGGRIGCLFIFNCLGRYLEAEAKGITAQLFAEYSVAPLIGFNTYGEQYCSLHINHTFTGLALGK